MEETIVKKSNKKIISWVLVTILLISAISGVLIFLFRDKLEYDYELGKVALSKVENAQYIPDVTKYNSGAVVLSGPRLGDPVQATGITQEEFNAVVDEYATIENYAGAGKYLGYDIHEIKNEIAFVVEHVPAFNQWFRMPTMREKEGYINIPYYEWWAYYLEMGEDNVLSITRVCWSTTSSYLDFENQKTVENYGDGSSFIQFEVMKTNYFVDENEKEVVECFIYSVGVDKAIRHYNDNPENYYPFEYQYLKNVEDTYLIKYHITASERYRDDNSFDEGGMDITGEHPYGSHREFTILNYDGYSNITLTEIEQYLPTRLITTDTLTGLSLTDENLILLNETVSLTDEEFVEITTEKDYMNAVCKKIVDNFDIKNNWPEIYKNQSEAFEIEMIKGPFYGENLIINDVSFYTSCRGHNQEQIEFSASANIYDESAFDSNKEYSLSVAMKERTTGELKIIHTAYYLGFENQEYYYNEGYTGVKDVYAAMSCTLDSSVINVEKDGVYDFALVLTEKVDDEDVIMIDTLEVAYLRSFYGLKIPDSVDSNGKTHSYSVKSTGGRLTITVTTKYIEE